jgi:hypothetical protein
MGNREIGKSGNREIGKSGRSYGKGERRLLQFHSYFKSDCSTRLQNWQRHGAVDANTCSGANRKGNLVSRQLYESSK